MFPKKFSRLLRRAGAIAAVGALCASGCDATDPEALESALRPAMVNAAVKKGILSVAGTRGADHIRLRLQSSTLLGVDIDDDGTAEFTFDRSKFDHIRIDAAEGDDVVIIDDSGGPFTDTELTTIIGGAGNDTLFGGVGAETISGGAGDDLIHAGRGNDTISMGDGNDTVTWDPGDGNDVVDGDGGSDVVVFNGANIGESFDLTAYGSRVRLTRDIASITTDIGSVERIDLIARGGADRITVNNLAGTSVSKVNVDLTGGDAVADVVVVQGTANADTINVAADGASVVATGLATTVSVTGGEPELDAIQINGTGGDRVNVNGSPAADTMTVSESSGHGIVQVAGFSVLVDAFGAAKISVNGLGGDDTIRLYNSANQLPVQLDGGEGNDQIFGGNWPDVLLGGPGDDVIAGGGGSDTILMGDGNDTFVWNPGDGNDLVDGEAGNDTISFNGANIGEAIELSANATHLRITRDIAAITTDAVGCERVDVIARGGADRITVNNLAGTSVSKVNVDLTSGDALADVVVVQGSANAETIDVAADGASVVATGLAATVSVFGGEPSLDSLQINGTGGDRVNVNGSPAADVMTVSESSGHAIVQVAGFNVLVDAFAAAKISVNGLGGDDTIRLYNSANQLPVQLDGGEGNDQLFGGNWPDVILGGPGDDVIAGGGGTDTILMGDGNDTFVWNPGDGSDFVNGDAGNDALTFNGANIGEQLTLSANGSHLIVTRDIASVALDLVGIERADVIARGGSDRVTVNDLAGTGVSLVNLELASQPGSGTGDAATDLVLVQGSPNPDAISLTTDGNAVVVSGLAATTRILTPEPTDQLVVNGLAGVDTFSVGSGVTSLMTVSVQD